MRWSSYKEARLILSPLTLKRRQTFLQASILCFKFSDELYERSVLIAQKGKLLDFFSANKGVDVVDVIACPLWKFIDS